jgi:intermediate peptidase
LEKFAKETVENSFLNIQNGSIDRRAYASLAKGEEPAFAGVVKGLRSPDDWRRIAAKAEDDCRSMIDDVILKASGASVIQGLDTISDRVCQVIDVAEFCRHVHCEEEWRRAAHETCMSLGAFVHELNTHYGLYSALDSALESPDAATYSSEYVEVGKMLRRDFQRFGVHLQGEKRDRMACLVSEIQEIGHLYMKNAIDLNKTSEIVLPSHWNVGNGLGRLDPEVRGLFRSNSEGSIAANGDSRTCSYLLWHCDKEEIRKAAFQTYHMYPEDNKVLVHELLRARHEVATIMGYDSYTAYQLHDFSLSNIPEAAGEFLKAMQNAILPKLEQEMQILQGAKSSISSDAGGIEPWDVDWAVMKATDTEIWKRMSVLHGIFTVEGFINGMSALLERLMGVRLSVEDVDDGESWAPNVLKISILDSKSSELFGTVFLDLFQRPGKFGGAALFTLRCGRKLEEGDYQVCIIMVTRFLCFHFIFQSYIIVHAAAYRRIGFQHPTCRIFELW